jgi:hypothetical protein
VAVLASILGGLATLNGCGDAAEPSPESSSGSVAGSSSSISGAGQASAGASSGGVATAGAPAGGSASGGDASSEGGSVAKAGNSAQGGSAGAVNGGAGSAGAPGGGAGSGDTSTWTATDYASRKWARWPIPNPATLKLPHPMSFTAEGETVRDAVTGLVWEKTPIAQTMTWQAALDYCTQKGDGFSLPTRIELTSIVDNTQSGAKVGSPLFVFQPKAGWTWASTPWVVNSRKTVDPPLSWFINLSQGDSNNSLSQLAASAYARCVRVPQTQQLATAHYTVASGTVRDNYTGLTWQQAHSADTPTFTSAQAAVHCTQQGAGWRLPSLNELASVVDDVPSGNVSPAVDHVAFPGLSKDQWYWSASPHGTSTTEQWMLNFMDGFTKHQPTSTLGIALCVHD